MSYGVVLEHFVTDPGPFCTLYQKLKESICKVVRCKKEGFPKFQSSSPRIELKAISDTGGKGDLMHGE